VQPYSSHQIEKGGIARLPLNIGTTDLIRIPLISYKRAQVLNELGITTIHDLLSCNPTTLSHHEKIKRCNGSFSKQIPLIMQYARSIAENKIIVTGIDENFKNIDDSKVYFLDLEYDANSFYIFLYGLMDSKRNITQIFVEEPSDEKNALEEFLEELISKRDATFVTYASKAADKPILMKSLNKFGLPITLVENVRFFDLFYDVIFTQKPGKQKIFLPIKPITEKTVSDYFGYKEPKNLQIHNGLQALLEYKRYLKSKNEKVRKQLLKYNRSDLERIRLIFSKIYDVFKEPRVCEPIL